MNKKEIYKNIKELAKSQGYYCNLLKIIDADDSGNILAVLENQNFNDVIDMILFLEC